MSGSKKAVGTRTEAPKSQWPLDLHLRVAQESIASARTIGEFARQLSWMFGEMAKELLDPTITPERRTWLESHVERVWRSDLFYSDDQGKQLQIVALVESVAFSAKCRREDAEGLQFYLNAGLLHFRTRFPQRTQRFADLVVLMRLHEAVHAWDSRGRGSRKWRAIESLAASIGLNFPAEKIRQMWEDAKRAGTRK